MYNVYFIFFAVVLKNKIIGENIEQVFPTTRKFHNKRFNTDVFETV